MSRGPTDSGVDPASSSDHPKREAWDRFYLYCFEIVAASPSIRRLRGADRDDCIQDVMLELVRKFGEDDRDLDAQNVTGWIHTVSRNKAADIARRRLRKPEIAFSDGSGEAIPMHGDASDALTVGESVSVVWEALLQLDHEVTVTSYLVFFLRQIEGWDIPEVAEALQISPDQVRFRCHRVKQRFAEILKSHPGGRAYDPGSA